MSGSSFESATLPSRSSARTKHISLSTWAVILTVQLNGVKLIEINNLLLPELCIAFTAFLSFVNPSRSNSSVCNERTTLN